VKTVHDQMRESLTEKAQTPTATTTEAEGERAQSQMTGDPKKVSSGPFRSSPENRKTENQPGLPGLSPVQGRVCGGQHPITPTVQGSSAHTVRVQRKRTPLHHHPRQVRTYRATTGRDRYPVQDAKTARACSSAEFPA